MSGNNAQSFFSPAQPALEQTSSVLHPEPFSKGLKAMTEFEEKQETRRALRARRQALAMLIGSSIVSLVILYGLWTLVIHFV